MEFILTMFFEFLIYYIPELTLDGIARLLGAGKPLPGKDARLRRVVGWSLLGAVLGLFSILAWNSHTIANPAARLTSLLVVPLLCGLVMASLGSSMTRREKRRQGLEYFSSAFGFAMAFGLIRFLLCN